MKIQILKNQEGKDSIVIFYCPACRECHPYNINNSNPKHNWLFNEHREKPTFTPSLRVLDGKGNTSCHLFITAGLIQYCNDCPHEYAGKTIDLPDIPEELIYNV